MFTINVKADVQPTIDYLNKLAKGIGDKAITSALNKTVTQAERR